MSRGAARNVIERTLMRSSEQLTRCSGAGCGAPAPHPYASLRGLSHRERPRAEREQNQNHRVKDRVDAEVLGEPPEERRAEEEPPPPYPKTETKDEAALEETSGIRPERLKRSGTTGPSPKPASTNPARVTGQTGEKATIAMPVVETMEQPRRSRKAPSRETSAETATPP